MSSIYQIPDAVGTPPSGAAGGDLTGTYPNPTIKASVSLTTPVLGVATATSLAIGGATIGSNGLAVTGHILVEGVTSAGATGTGNFVFATTPTLTTPVLGVATVTSINKVAFTAPSTAATIQFSADNETVILPTGTMVAGGETLITATALSAVASSGVLGLSGAAGVVGLFAGATNATALIIKTLSSSTIANGSIRFQTSNGTNQAGIASRFNIADTANIEFLNNATTTMQLSAAGGLSIGSATDAGAGQLIVNGLKTTGAATGKTVVCVDTTTGKLYASTSGVACAN